MKLLDTCLKVEIEGLILYYTTLYYTNNNNGPFLVVIQEGLKGPHLLWQ